MDRAMHADRVMRSGGNVDGAVPWHNPGFLFGSQPHDPVRRIEQLIALVFMKWNYKAIGKAFGHHPNRLGQILIIPWVRTARFLDRHDIRIFNGLQFGTNTMKFGMTSHFRQA
jgi:hypothetical protein